MKGNQVAGAGGRKSKKGSGGGKGASESVRWERAAGWLCPGNNVQRTLGLRKLCPAKRASSPSSSSILQERDSTRQALAVREHQRHQGAGEAVCWPGSRHGTEELSSCQPLHLWGCTLTPRRREGACSRDLPGILRSSLHLVFITFPLQAPSILGLSASPTTVNHPPVLSSAFPSLEPLTS